ATVWNRFIAPHSSAPAGPPAAAHSEIGWARLSLPPAALASAAFLGLGVLQLVWSPSPDTAEAAQAVERALACDADSLPAQIGPWRREKFDTVEREVYSDFGRYSRSY